ncbi:MAG: transcription-repair coupling factor [Myxococcaceae bacterium]|nr:transcription-repair coupling factor [Myxococcaceae bacterium]MBH2006420.1 transcription-repair coupling factor [Myxococcaceae bacterium]
MPGLRFAHELATHSQKNPLVVVTRNSSEATHLVQDLRFLLQEEASKVWHLSAEDKNPYQQASPDPIARMERLSIFQKLLLDVPYRVLVITPEALCAKIPSADFLQNHLEFLSVKSVFPRDSITSKLALYGYTAVNQVEDPGTYSVRGSIVDFFWAGNSHPTRVDLFGDEIERLYTFDPSTQRKLNDLEDACFGLSREIILDEASQNLARVELRSLADELEYPTRALKEKLTDINHGIAFFGIESLLPAFHAKLGNVLDLIGSAQIWVENTRNCLEQIWLRTSDFESHYKTALVRGDLAFATPSFLHSAAEIKALLPETERDFEPPWQFGSTSELAQKIHRLHQDKISVLLPVQSLSGIHRYRELLEEHGIQVRQLPPASSLFAPFEFHPAIHAYTYVAKPEPPATSAWIESLHLAIIPEDSVFGSRAKRTVGKKGRFKTNLSDLEIGDAIVHIDHGIGQFQGLTRLHLHGIEQDYLLLLYANNDKLYLPAHRIAFVKPYSGAEGEKPKLDKLGGTGWQSKKKKVHEAVLAMAQDLLNLYAKRELVSRTPLKPPESAYYEFEALFPFETTPDQQKAIDEVLADLQKNKPMDRLICGDVGYGKTEVAMRAAMLSLLNHRQVAILAPTTILAQQHGITFRKRFEQTGARIEIISRFQTNQQINAILEATKMGQVDILIGTHRLLSSDVQFKDLGLVIVDEEQRFGIKDKEHIKRLRTHTDILTLSATPIPRTLQMGFFGLRDLSVIETPPVDRRAIRTSLIRFEDESIREAILRELQRGGQVYFVHNRVSSIEAKAEYLRNLVPEARIEVAHGQMNEHTLEDRMVRFMNHDFNVFVCTTIIETGIDVSSANTMLIDHADDFGLAQLYQLRGRIGRSKERAFAYLVIPGHEESLTPMAQKRLEILQRFSELGAGFRIAQHDLELRGAGDLLGKSQHGHVAAVGYDLYADLLREAIDGLKGSSNSSYVDPDVHFPVSAVLAESYIPDLHERMSTYQRLAVCLSEQEVWDIIGELEDRYGVSPDEVKNLAEMMLIKHLLRKLGFSGLDLSNTQAVISLGEKPNIEALNLASFVQANANQWSLSPKMKLTYRIEDPNRAIASIKSALRHLREALPTIWDTRV